MALKILSSPNAPGEVVKELRGAIERAIPGAVAEVVAASPGHFELRVTSDAFSGQTRVQQQQLVYGAIAHLMQGDAAPVHAVDRLVTREP